MPTISDLLTGALTEIRVARSGDVLPASDQDLALTLLNELLDEWNADRRAVYSEGFADYTLTPNLSPHTIGPAGTFPVTQRPVSVEYWALNLGGSPAVFTATRRPITYDAYARRAIPGLSTAIPTALYYEPAWPLGQLYFWPIPTAAYGVRLWTRVLLASVVATDTFSLPPGYQAALRLTLAERAASSFGQTVSEQTRTAARGARTRVFSNNDVIPNACTVDGGMPSGPGGFFDYRTGMVED